MEPEASQNIFEQIQNKGSASEPLSQQYLTQERANAAIGTQTSLQNAGNVKVDGNQFNLKASPYMQTAGAQGFQEGMGALGRAAPKALAAYLVATGVGAPVGAAIYGATGSGLATTVAAAGTGLVAMEGTNQVYDALYNKIGFKGQEAHARIDEPTATAVGEFAPWLAVGKPWGEGSWNKTTMAAMGLVGGVNAVASQGVYNPTVTPEDNAWEIAKQTGMGIGFGTMGPTHLGESIASIGAKVGLNNPLYRAAVKSTVFNGGDKPMFTDGAINGVSFKESGGTATIYDPVSGTGRVLFREADGTVTVVNYNNLEGQAAKNSGQSTFGLRDSGPGSVDFNVSKYGTPKPPEEEPFDIPSGNQPGPTGTTEQTGPIGRGRQLNEPQWGQQGDVGKPDGRGPVFGQDAQAPGPVTTQTKPSAAETPAAAVAPAVTEPVKPSAPTPSSSTTIIPEGYAPTRPTPAEFGIPENPSMEWHSNPENQKLWTKYSNSVNRWDMDYAMTHRADGRPLSQGSTAIPEATQTTSQTEYPEWNDPQWQKIHNDELNADEIGGMVNNKTGKPFKLSEIDKPTARKLLELAETQIVGPIRDGVINQIGYATNLAIVKKLKAFINKKTKLSLSDLGPATTESPAAAVSGVETPATPVEPTAPIPKPSSTSKPTIGTATAERPSPGEIPGPAETGQTPSATSTGQTTGTQGKVPTGKPGSESTVTGPAEAVSSELPTSIPAPIIPERKKDATREEILSGVRGMDETTPSTESTFTNNERAEHFKNRAKHLINADPTTLSEKDIRDRASLISSEKPVVQSDQAVYDGPKLPAFVESGVAMGKTFKQIYDESGENQKLEILNWYKNQQIWLDSISHNNKSPSEIATSATPESIANQNHTIADAGYTPVTNSITNDIKNGGQVVAVSDFNKSTDLKHKLNHDESTYLRHPQTQKAVSIRMPDGTVKHYQVRGPLFLKGLARNEAGKIISDDPLSIYESKLSGESIPVGTPTVLQFTPNALTEVNPINASQLNSFHTNKIQTPAKPAPTTQAAIEVAKPTPATKPKELTPVQKFRREPKNIALSALKNNGYLIEGLRLDKNKSLSEYTPEQINNLKRFIKTHAFQSDLTPSELEDVIHHLVTINNAHKELGLSDKDFRRAIASVFLVNERLVYYEDFTPAKLKEELEFDKKLSDEDKFGFGPTEYETLVQKLKDKGMLDEQGNPISKPEPVKPEPEQQAPLVEAKKIDEVTGLPLNEDGTVTLYHHTNKVAADEISKTGILKSNGEPDVYLTTRKETDTGYGDTAVAIRVNPSELQIDDQFPNGRKDFRINVKIPKGQINVNIEPSSKPAVKEINTAVGKVSDQIEKLIDLGNTKSAKNVFETVLARLQEIEDDAVADSGFRTVEYVKEGKLSSVYIDGQTLDVFFEKNNISEELQKEVKHKITVYRSKATPSELKRIIELDVSNLLSKGKYTIKIPGDGTFKIAANPVAIRALHQNIKSEGSGLWKGLSKWTNQYGKKIKETINTKQELDDKLAEIKDFEKSGLTPRETSWEEHNKNQEENKPKEITPSTDAVPSAAKNKGNEYKNFDVSIFVEDGNIRFSGRKIKGSTLSDFDIEYQDLFKSYASNDAAPMRRGAYPAFFDNSELGDAGSWITTALPMAGGNFLIYEINPRGQKGIGNARNRTVRLFRYVVNSSGNHLTQPVEINKNGINGFYTKNKQGNIPALAHGMISAADDYTRAKSMSVNDVVNISGGRAVLSGETDANLRDYEDTGNSPPGLRQRLEEFNALPSGNVLNNYILDFMADVTDNEVAKKLLGELQVTANMSIEAGKSFIRDLIEAQSGDQSIINLNIVKDPSPSEDYPTGFESALNKTTAQQMKEWYERGRKSLVSHVGTDDPATGKPYPKLIQKPGNDPKTGKPWTKPKRNADGTPALDADGKQIHEPWMVSNPKRWNVQIEPFVNEETYHVKDADGNTIFKPMPYQVEGMNLALTRFLTGSTPVNTGEVARAFLNMDAPGLGKTIQILGTAKTWHEKMKVWTKDPNSPWFGKSTKVLIVSQNRTILKNAFGGDAAKMGLDLSGEFKDVGGGNIKFIPKKITGTTDGGESIDGEESWVDFGTYGDIKPQFQLVPKINEKTGKPDMVPDWMIGIDGEFILGPDGKKIAHQVDDGKGGTTNKMVEEMHEVRSGPPVKGSGEWGLVIFDECHNMKNMDSGRSQAGHDLFIRSQHVLLATGTPIDKPQLLGYFIAMVLDVSLHEIAAELQMTVSGSKISHARKDKTFTAKDFRDSLSTGHWAKMKKDKQADVFNMSLNAIRRIRDRAGVMGRLVRRGKAFYGTPDIWLDLTDENGKDAEKMIIKHEDKWFEFMEADPKLKASLMGQFLMESKRLAACIKLGVPNTMFNTTNEPRGALRILLNELKDGRKVIITVDTTNELGVTDPDLKSQFKGLIAKDNKPTKYDSELTMLKDYLTKAGIKFGTIVGADIKDRQNSINLFQKNDMEVPVMIMTISSGGTGLSLQDLFNVNREWGYDRKTGEPKTVLSKEEEEQRNELRRTADPDMGTYDKPIPTDSHPRSMIIVSAPWGGDAVEQVIGRADRMNTTTPTRVFWLTTEISSGDAKLINTVRSKIATLNAMIKNGDDLDALMEGGMEGGDAQSAKEIERMGQSRKLPKDVATTLAQRALNTIIKSSKIVIESNEKEIKEILLKDENLDIPDNKAKVNRKRNQILSKTKLINSVESILAEIANGKFDPYTVDVVKIEQWLKTRGIGEKEEKIVNENGEEEIKVDDDEDNNMDNVYKNIIKHNIITNSDGVDIIVTPSNITKSSRNRVTNVIKNLYGLQSAIVPENATQQEIEKINSIFNDIVRPFQTAYANKQINSRRFAAMLSFARDIAWRLHDYTISSVYASTKLEAQEYVKKGAAGEINIAAKELMTLMFSEDVSKALYAKPYQNHLTAKPAMWTMFHEVGHALMRLIPDEMKQEMLNELNQARKSWFDGLPNGDVRKSLSMPEYDWHYTAGIRNYNFKEQEITSVPLPNWSTKTKTFQGITYTRNEKVHNSVKSGGQFFNSSIISAALEIFARHPDGLNDIQTARKFGQTADIVKSGIGGEGQLGFKLGSGAIAPFLSLFNFGVFNDMSFALNSSLAPLIETRTEYGTNNELKIEKSKRLLSVFQIQKMVIDGKGYITTTDNPNEALITTILEDGKLIHYLIDAKSLIAEVGKDYLSKLRGKTDEEKLSFLKTTKITQEFIYGASDENSLRLSKLRNRNTATSYESRIYKLLDIDEWLAENSAAYARDYYMLGNYSNEISMTGDIVASLFVNASAGGDAKLTRRIISSIFQNTIKEAKDSTESGQKFYMKYGSGGTAGSMDNSQQSGSLSPPNQNILPKGMSVTEESILKTGKASTFNASAIKYVKSWAYHIAELKLWAYKLGKNNITPSNSSINKKLNEVIEQEKLKGGEAKTTAETQYGAEGLVGTLVGKIEQIGRITDNDMIRELGKRISHRSNTGEINRGTYTEDNYVFQNYWQSVFDNVIEKHLGDKIAKSSENRNRLLSLHKVFNISGKNFTLKPEFKSAMTDYILNVFHPEYNKLTRALAEAEAYLSEGNFEGLTESVKEYLHSIGVIDSKTLYKARELVAKIKLDVETEVSKYGHGSKYDNYKFLRESDHYIGKFFEDGTVDKMLMDVGRAMSVSRNRTDYDAYMASNFSKEVIAAAHDLTEKWAKPYREWASSMGEEINDWGTSWRPRIIDADTVHGIRNGVRNRADLFIRKAAEAIYKDNKHQRVLLPHGFKKFFEENNYFMEYGGDASVMNAGSAELGQHQHSYMWREWFSQYNEDDGTFHPFLQKRIAELLDASESSELKSIDEQDSFGFDVGIEPVRVVPKHPADNTILDSEGKLVHGTNKALGILAALKSYLKLLKKISKVDKGYAVDNEKTMIQTAITRLEEQHNRKSIEQKLSMTDAFELATKFADRILNKSIGIGTTGNGYEEIFGGQFGDLNKADSMKERLMECEFADDLLSEFYNNDVRIFGKHYNRQVTRAILIKKYIPEKFFKSLSLSVKSNPKSTQYWEDIVFILKRITESDQEESSDSLVKSYITLAAQSTFMTLTSALQFAEPINYGFTFKHRNAVDAAWQSSRAVGGNLAITVTAIANSLAKVSTQIITAGNYEASSAPGLRNYTKENQFFYRLAKRVGIIQNRYLEGLDTSTADMRTLPKRMADLALERFHHSGSGLTAVTDASRVSVMKATIMSLETMADEIITRTSAANIDGKYIPGDELKILTVAEKMTFRNLGVLENEIPDFLKFCVSYRASISGDYSTMSPEVMDALIDKRTHITPRFEKYGKRGKYEAEKDNRIAQTYFNALARINFDTVQITARATEQRTRAWFTKVIGSFGARLIFFLTHYMSSFSRNVILPALRLAKSAVQSSSKQYSIAPGMHDPSHRLGNLPGGAYLSNISNPYAGFRNSINAVTTMATVWAMLIASNYKIREVRSQFRQNPAIYIYEEPEDWVKAFAAIDSAGLLGNLSLPINTLTGGLRYGRQSAQLVAGPYVGKLFGTIDKVNETYGMNNKNSPNTPTAERATAGLIYDAAIRPIISNSIAFMLPRTDVGDMLNFAVVQSMAHPGVKEAFKQAFPGSGEAVPLRKSVIEKMYAEKKLTPSAYQAAIKRREAWEIAHPTGSDSIGEREKR